MKKKELSIKRKIQGMNKVKGYKECLWCLWGPTLLYIYKANKD